MMKMRKEEIYRVYETDCLKYVCFALGIEIEKRYYDILHPSKQTEPEETCVERLERFGIKVVE